MNLQQLSNIALIIIRAQTHKTAGRINAFFVASGSADYDSANFNQSVADGQLGMYWGRAWASSGKNPNALCAEYPALFLRPSSLTYDSDLTVCKTIEVGVIYPQECEGCGWTIEQAEELATAQLIAFIDELSTVALYEGVDISASLGGIGFNDYWLSRGQFAYMKDNGVRFNNMGCSESINMKHNGAARYFTYGTQGNIIITSDVTICGCLEHEIQYDFSQAELPQVSVTKCTTC